MKKLVTFFFTFILSISLFSQSYTTAGGLRFGTEWGVTIQQRVLNRTTVEFLGQSGLFRDEILFTVLAEQHIPLISKRLNVYFGGGVHKGWWKKQDLENPKTNPVGISAVAGAEFTLSRLIFSYDIIPALNIAGGEFPVYFHTGLSVRYVLIRGNVFKKHQRKKKIEKHKKDFKKKIDDIFH